MMKHYRRGITVVRRHLPTLVMRDDESPRGAVGSTQESPATTTSPGMPKSTMAVVIVLTIVGFLAIVLAVFFVYRSRKSKRNQTKRRISPPMNAKHVNLDAASMISEPKRALVGGAADGASYLQRPSGDDKYPDMESFEQLSKLPSQSKTAMNVIVPKPSLKKKSPKKALDIVRRLSRLGVPPPPSYSPAFAGIGGIDEEMMAMKYPVPSSSAPEPKPDDDTRMEVRPPVISTTFKWEASAGRPSRTSSFIKLDALNTTDDSSQTPASASTSPKLMTVINTFTPTLDDELPLTIGDTVRMLEEFKDGWCTVQYLGKHNAAKGAVPRFCLQEHNVVPSHKIC